MNKVLSTFFLVLGFTALIAGDVATLADARSLAKKSDKPILIDFWSDNWGGCIQFARAAEEDAEVIKELASVILVKIHNKKGADVALLETYKVRGYPTFVLENNEGETLHRWWGYSKEGFLKEIEAGLADPTTIVEKMTRYKTKPDLHTALALASNFSTIGEMTKVVSYYKDAAKFDNKNDYAYELYSAYRRGLGRPFTEDDIIKATDSALASEFVDLTHKLRIYDQMCAAIIH